MNSSSPVDELGSVLCFRNVCDYLERPSSVLMHADFPAKPPSLINYYCRKFGCTAGFGKIKVCFSEFKFYKALRRRKAFKYRFKEVIDRMKEDHVGRAECERELCELEVFAFHAVHYLSFFYHISPNKLVLVEWSETDH